MRILLTRFFLLALALLVLVSRSHWQPGSWGTAAIFFVALVLVSAAVAGRMWCSLYIAGYKNSQLVQEGPYSMSRNPLYFFSLLGAMGCAITTENFTLPVLVALAFALYYPGIIKNEETYLQKRHGAAFESYRTTVPSFFPSFGLMRQPAVYEVKPGIFLNHLGSAVWFILALGVIQLLKAAHHTGYLPTWFTLY